MSGLRVPARSSEDPDKYQARVREAIEKRLTKLVGHGYEGVMIRDANAAYKHGRSAGLLKYKRFHDEEYPIVDVVEGGGKNTGTALLVCCMSNGETFRATAPGTYSEKATAWQEREEVVGRLVIIKYQEKSKDGVPRFPVAKAYKD